MYVYYRSDTCIHTYIHTLHNVTVIILKGVTIKIFPGPDFPVARGVLIA